MPDNPIHTFFQVLRGNLPDQLSLGEFRWFEVALYWVLLKLAVRRDAAHGHACQHLRYSSFHAHSAIMQVFLDHIALVQPLVFLLETALALSLMLGFTVRLAGVVGVPFILNLLIGPYNDPTEWPRNYVGIIRTHGMFAVAQAGHSFGIDNLLAKCLIPGLPYDGPVARAIALAS
jgi:hypothetical protein